MNPENEVWKFLTELSRKKGITEIIINNVDNVYIERQGEMIRLDFKFSPNHIKSFCQDVANFNRVQFNVENPVIDGLLPDGSRINIISSDYTSTAPAITIRKYLKNIKKFDSSPGIFGLNEKWVKFLKTLVSAKMNVIVSGGTGNGKTTLLNLLLNEVSSLERVITIEDTKELNFDLSNCVRLISKRKSSQLANPLGTRDLLKNTLRMRPDRIIIGEVRGAEAFDMLQAMNTGHEGSMCSIHSNSPPESLSRLENLFMMSGHEIPVRVVRAQIASAIDFIVQLGKSKNGSRLVSRVSEVSNMEGEQILLQDIGNSSELGLEFTGLVPKRMSKLMEYGLSADFFMEM